MRVFQIQKGEILIINGDKQYSDTVENFKLDSELTLKDLNEVIYDNYQECCVELDRVLGGGVVAGSLVLFSGAPGIGKSTLLLQICSELCRQRQVLYCSGEESEQQLKLRADRLGVHSERLFVLCETDVGAIIETIFSEKPDIVIIDSIQTMSLADVASSPGNGRRTDIKTGVVLSSTWRPRWL